MALFMVIETFKDSSGAAVAARFGAQGRMIPEGSRAAYIASWMCADGARCYQLMEAPSRAELDGWIANWRDLVDFDVVEVQASAEYWQARRR